MTTRRQFLATMGAGLGVMANGQWLGPGLLAPSEKLRKVGIQLYTVRSLLSKDFEGTIAELAKIGYGEVEFAGYFSKTPAQVRELLAAHKLTSPSSHIAFPKDDDAWRRTLEQAHEVGHDWVTIAWLDAGQRGSPDAWKRIAERFNQLGAMAQAAGLRFAYHNHDFELKPFDGTNGLETLLRNTDAKSVDFEMDIYWVVKGGGDPLDFISRFPGRFPLVHAKDATSAPDRKMVDVGAGTIDFARIFAAAKPKHVFVEHDSPLSPMGTAQASYRYLRALTF